MKRMKRTMRWTIAMAVATALGAAHGGAQSPVQSPTEMAAETEAAASTLHDRPDRWADAATLYVAAAGLRDNGDPWVQKDLFLAANLSLESGDVAGAINALESAGSRALANGDRLLGREMFANAALVARRAGLGREYRRLRSRTNEAAAPEASDLAFRTPR